MVKVKQELEQYMKEHKVDHDLKFSDYNAEQF